MKPPPLVCGGGGFCAQQMPEWGGLLLHLHAVEDDGDDGLHLIRAGLRNQDNESHQRGIRHALFAIDEKRFVAIQKIEENGGGYAFIAIGKAVIFDNEIQEARCFFRKLLTNDIIDRHAIMKAYVYITA